MRPVAYLNAKSAAAYLDFPSVRAFYAWLARPGRKPKRHYLGRQLRFRQVDLDACVESIRTEDAAAPLTLVAGGRK